MVITRLTPDLANLRGLRLSAAFLIVLAGLSGAVAILPGHRELGSSLVVLAVVGNVFFLVWIRSER